MSIAALAVTSTDVISRGVPETGTPHSNKTDTIESVFSSFQDSKICLVHAAAWNGEAAALLVLKELGFDVNQKNDLGECPAHYAAIRGHAEVLKTLHKLGADLAAITRHGSSPAHWAAAENHVDILMTLNELGVNMRRQNFDGKTPLDWAVSNNSRQAANWLRTNLATI